jgi:hypothetical protein
MERILNGQPELAHTLDQVKQEATRRAIGTKVDHIICMDSQGNMLIRVGEDYLDEIPELVALVYCFVDGTRKEIKQKGEKK